MESESSKMTFLMHFIQRDGRQWFCDIERVDLRHATVGLYTNQDGQGLSLDRHEGNVERLLSEVEFAIAPGSGTGSAAAQIAQALEGLGWGPEVEKHGEVVLRQECS
jgi:hypothetical protein